MALIRAIPLKNFTSALSTAGAGTAFQVGALTSGQYLYGGLHLTCGPAGSLGMTIQSATASGFGTATTHIAFLLSSGRGSTWGTPVTNLSTENSWFRAKWTATTEPFTGLVYMGIR